MKYIFIIITLFTMQACLGDQKEQLEPETTHSHSKEYYTCSMHPQIKEDGAGKCPICGMNLTKVTTEDSTITQNQEENYYCEVDPSVTSTVPGDCPLDGTPMLEKRIVAQVKIKKNQLEHFRADTYEVRSMKMLKKIRLLGTILKAQNRESNIPARVPGRVEDVIIVSTGSFVKKGDPVLKLYSPKLLTGGDEYLLARKNYFSNRESKEFKELFEQSAQRMKLWGIQDFQLEAWAKKNKVPREIMIYSPVTGIVEKKNAIQGKYFNEGESFFDLVDLSSLWVEMDVYEHDSALVGLGQEVKLEFSAYPGEIFQGKIDFVSPVLDIKTRTLKIRTTLDNSSGKLRPGMVGTASVHLELEGSPLVIPRTAVIDTGKRKVVWVKGSTQKYQARIVHTGFESEGYLEVKSGLNAGDVIVTDGNFLLDAQAQLFGGYHDSKND